MMNSSPAASSSEGFPTRSLAIFLGSAVVVAGLDLWSKAWAFGLVRASEDGRVALWPGRLEFIIAYNNAGIWSVGRGVEHSNLLLTAIAGLVAVVVFGWGLWLAWQRQRAAACLAGFILGGAVGNLYDRLAYGGVRDFIQVYLWGDPPYPYPTFNVADSFLVCSVATLILGQWWTGRAEAKRQVAPAS
jgi:signal peptidase II